MFTKFYDLNCLAVCVAAVVSGLKKAVSPVAAAVVGIGLFLAPIESAQAQESPYYYCPEVTGLTLFFVEASDYELSHGFDGYSFSFDWVDVLGSGWTHVVSRLRYLGGGYFRIEIDPDPLGGADDWIKLNFYIQPGPDASVSAWVEDGDGNWYSVDVTIVFGG